MRPYHVPAVQHFINPIVVAPHAQPIEFRVSIGYGTVTIARIGAPRRFNANAALGVAANFSSKMLRYVKAGDIVVGEAAKALLPIEWQIRWTIPLLEPTGWVYRSDHRPYPL